MTENVENYGTRKKIRCSVCQKVVNSVEQVYCKCRCGIIYCPAHRFPGALNTDCTHKCDYDFKVTERNKLREFNPRIIVDKVPGRV